MLPIGIRAGRPQDSGLITTLIREMVVEMAAYGGHRVNTSPSVWSTMEEAVKANTTSENHCCLLAYLESSPEKTVGMAAANIDPLENIFEPKKRLHISAVYTIPAARHKGVAGQLIQRLLAWGQVMDVVEADLHVLVGNPARQLYEKLGFEPHEISLVKRLRDDQK